MSLKSQMPWDALRGETIRLVIRELGFDYVGLRKDEMINYLHVVENTGLKNALRLQQKRKATQKVHSSPKRIRTTQDSPSKMVTRRDSMKGQEKQAGSSHLTFDCVLLDRPSSLHAPRKGKEPISDREQSPEIAILSLSPEIPPSSLPSDAEVAPTSEPAEEELMFPSSEPPEDVLNRSTVMLFGPPSKSVKTYAKRKVGRPRKSLG